MDNFYYPHPFPLENGAVLPELNIAYTTYGKMNAEGSNVVWVCHALTANSDAADWWNGVVGGGHVIDPAKHFIVCANILGSCYGTTGPLSINPETQKPYYNSFPMVTIRDMVQAHALLRRHLGINKIYLLMGGSMGGYQAMEWCLAEPEAIDNLLLLATSATESAWGIATHTAQRLCIEADCTWQQPTAEAGAKGLKAARAIGMLTYRNYDIMVQKQSDPDSEKLDNYKAATYINYQGDKLVARFNAYSYWLLTKSMDSHHIARGRGGECPAVLNKIKQQTLIIGISSDILCPVFEQKFLAKNIPVAKYVEIGSDYGHDGFMVESAAISGHLQEWLDTLA
ncbi:MAG TPA: homoserine O-acetyltransferase [Ferruginibacter sp.]|nr:homoserine O-acetyltransferase [Ferruginibacter sp.]HMP21877.1 homoserine O-acetyltransferase [Ferruginibacter sp.]